MRIDYSILLCIDRFTCTWVSLFTCVRGISCMCVVFLMLTIFYCVTSIFFVLLCNRHYHCYIVKCWTLRSNNSNNVEMNFPGKKWWALSFWVYWTISIFYLNPKIYTECKHIWIKIHDVISDGAMYFSDFHNIRWLSYNREQSFIDSQSLCAFACVYAFKIGVHHKCDIYVM